MTTIFSQLPDRMRKLFSAKQLNDAVFDSMTARSVELRYPNMAAVARQNRTYVKADPVYGSSAPTPYPRRNSAGGTFNAKLRGANRFDRQRRTDGSFLRWSSNALR